MSDDSNENDNDSDDNDDRPRAPPRARPTRSKLLEDAKVVLAFAAVYLIWGSTYLAIRVGVRSLPPFLMAGCRFVTAGGILYAILRARGVPAPSAVEWRRAALAGLLLLTTANGLVTWAETRLASNLAALLVAAVPIYVALLDWLRPGGVAPRRRVWLGIAIGTVGMALLVTGKPAAGATTSAAAIVAMLVSGLSWAAGSLYSRYGSMHRNPLMAAAQQMLAGGAAQLLLAVGRGEQQRLSAATLSAEGLLAWGYLTVAGSLIAFTAFGFLVKASTPARVSTTAYVNPVVAVILGWALLGERLEPRALVGASLIVCAVVIMTVRFGTARGVARR